MRLLQTPLLFMYDGITALGLALAVAAKRQGDNHEA